MDTSFLVTKLNNFSRWCGFAAKCRGCGSANIAKAKFCGHCGSPMPEKKSTFARHGIIYMFYLLILFSALTWRLASADSGKVRITSFVIKESAVGTDLVLSLNKLQKPVALFVGAENCLILEFPQTAIDSSLLTQGFASRDLRLGYFVDGSKASDKARIRLFVQPGCLSTIRYAKADVIVSLSDKKSEPTRRISKGRNLINPLEEKNSPAVISLQNAPLVPVVLELAERAGIEVKFSDSLPERFSLEFDAPTPLEAIKGLARACNLEFIREDRSWVLKNREAVKKDTSIPMRRAS